MSNLSPQWRRFVRQHRKRINVILMLAMINLVTSIMGGEFMPWFLFPSVFIAIPMLQDLFDMFMGEEDKETIEDDAEREETHAYEKPKRKKEPVAASVAQTITSPTIQAHLDKARSYKEQIDAYIQATTDPLSRDRLQDLSNQINEWTEAIEVMAHRIGNYRQNEVISQDLKSVPQSIKKLEEQLDSETNPAIRAEIERTLANRKNQLATLQQLENTMKQAEIKMESTLASVGTIYSQLLTSQSTNHVADYSRLSDDVNEEVRTLQDHLEALEEVKLGRT